MSDATRIDRRSLLQLAGASAFAVAARPNMAMAHDRAELPALIALADLRYEESVGYAARLRRHGAEIVPLDRDLAKVWFEVIAERLASGPLAVAGLTLSADLFGLERLAEGSDVTTRFARTVRFNHTPRRGRPRDFVAWMLGCSSRPGAMTG
jgi:hypothetical protein